MQDLFLQQIVNGLTLGAVYALIALGYTMVYGVLELINFAHGEVYMMGAYLGIFYLGLLLPVAGMQNHPGLVLVLVFLLSAVTSAGYGIAMERIAYRPLRRAHRLAPLISAIGVSIFFQNYVMLTQGSDNKIFPALPLLSVSFDERFPISEIQRFILLSSIGLMGVLSLFVNKTRFGRAMRATAQNAMMASLCGVPTDHILRLTFAMGSALAAAGGVMAAMYYGVTHFSMGYVAGMKAFTAAVLGGIGSIPGAMIGGILLGLVESLGSAYLSSEFKDGFAFLVLILVLIFRPTGLFGARQ